MVSESLTRTYRPQRYGGRMTVFRANDGILQPQDGVAADFGWAPIAGGGLDVVEVPGAHFTMLAEPHVEVLADALRFSMDVDTPAVGALLATG